MDRLTKIIALAEKERLYLDLTGLGCYHKKDVPGWYDKLAEKERWGKTPEDLRSSKTIQDALTLGWLELFEKKAKAIGKSGHE